ncbi:MAG TPA: nucleotide pyrophosphatase/phosphodiesterase family protein, partial [Chitinophagaceae bacterium]|nr:nucleotide pyrophosphatase/phosphodiesterase family protein [Chitinophagaceae bacterium]
NKLVQGEKIWEAAKRLDPSFTCSKMFWWYNMYSSADFSCTPRPQYLADGRKLPDCYTHPSSLRDELQAALGTFPLFQFWGPGSSIKSTQWIADASVYVDKKHDPTLTLIYLPHLDYCLQKFGPDFGKIAQDLQEVDAVVKGLVDYYRQKNARILLLSEYGITPVDRPIHLNRLLRAKGWVAVREERGTELLDAGASRAFAVADHQVAHIYLNDPSLQEEAAALLQQTPGVARVLDREAQKARGLDHERSGDLVAMADSRSWFTYYFWLDDARAPDYARVVDIHKKPGYDPVELFMTSKARAAYKLLRKKAGFRYVMDVIPLDASLVKGSHGSTEIPEAFHPVLITDGAGAKGPVAATDIRGLIWAQLTGT